MGKTCVEQDPQMPTEMEHAVAPRPDLEAPPGLERSSRGPSIQQTAPPPGLENAASQQPTPTPEEYNIDEKVSTLRSNGVWSPGVIKEVCHDKVVVFLKDVGVKNIRKEKMSS